MIAALLLLACAAPAGPRWTIDGAIAPAREKVDTNHDGKVTPDEYERVAFSAPDFEHVDTDQDGDISLAEMRVLVFSTDPSHFFEKPKVRVPGHAKQEAEELDAQANARPPQREPNGQVDGGQPDAGPPDGGQAAGPGPGGAERVGRGPGGPGGAGGPGGPGGGGPGGPGADGPGGVGGPGGPGGGGGPGQPPAGGPPAAMGNGPVHPSRPGPKPRPDTYYVLLVLRAEVISVDPEANVPTLEELRQIGISQPLDAPATVAALGRLEDAATALHLDFPASLRREKPLGP